MPDYGCARCDFPGGSVEQLFESIQRIYTFPDDTRILLNHDYLPATRTNYLSETSVKDSKESMVQANAHSLVR